jgi:hypothetical protein
VARVADHGDLELGLADGDALTDRPRHHLGAADGEVLTDDARLEIERREVVGRDEEDRALARARVRAALEPVFPDRRLVERLHRDAPSRRAPDADQLRHVCESSDRG